MKSTIYLFFCGILFTTACAPRPSETRVTEKVGNQTAEIIEEADLPSVRTEQPVYQATETILTDLIHTKLEVNFDWKKSRMNGKATITAKPHFYASDSVILDAKGMDILTVSIGKQTLKYTYDSLELKIKLGKTYTRNDTYTLVIDYVAKPEERITGGSAAIASDKGLYFINPTGDQKGKMPQIWTQGETEASSVWFPTIDTPNSKTTQEIFITVQDKYATLSNGKLISSVKNQDGTRTDYWKQDLPHAPYLFMMGIGEFKVVKDSYTRLNGSKMEVNYYVEPEWEPYAKAIFGETPEMIGFFSKLLGVEYPWDKYHQIVVRDYVSGAMENTGAVIFGDYAYKTDRELLDANDESTIAHELFHHWFGDLVTCESWSNLPLNESFANYSQYLWDEYRHGLDEADYQAEAEADGYFQSAQAQGHHELIWFDYEDKEQMFDGHSYNKGGRILHMLRNYLGDEAFFLGMSNYLKANQFKPAEFHQLRLAFEEVCGEDLNWFFNQWFLGVGHPIIYVSHQMDTVTKMISLTVEQKQDLATWPLFKLPLEVAIQDEKGEHSYKISVSRQKETFTFPVNGKLNNFIFDNQHMLLGKIKEDKSAEQYQYQYYHTKRYRSRKEALQFGTKNKDAGAQKLIVDGLNDPFWSLRALAIEKASKLTEASKTVALERIETMAKNDPNSSVRAAALNFLVSNGQKDKVTPLLVNRIDEDRSYKVVGTALKQLGKTNPSLALEKARVLEKETASSMMNGIGQLYGAYADSSAFSWFKEAIQSGKVQGFDEVGMLGSYTYWLSRQQPELIIKGLAIYTYVEAQGGMYAKMFVNQNFAFLSKQCETKLAEVEQEIAAHEKNGNALYADQSRKRLKEWQQVQILLDQFN
jgi:aminopeptidase N